MISLKRLNPNFDSPLLNYVKDKGMNEISVNDLNLEFSPSTSRLDSRVSLAGLFSNVFDKLSGNNTPDVAGKDLVNALVKTGKFDKFRAENQIQMAMNQGIIFERKAGFYSKA